MFFGNNCDKRDVLAIIGENGGKEFLKTLYSKGVRHRGKSIECPICFARIEFSQPSHVIATAKGVPVFKFVFDTFGCCEKALSKMVHDL